MARFGGTRSPEHAKGARASCPPNAGGTPALPWCGALAGPKPRNGVTLPPWGMAAAMGEVAAILRMRVSLPVGARDRHRVSPKLPGERRSQSPWRSAYSGGGAGSSGCMVGAGFQPARQKPSLGPRRMGETPMQRGAALANRRTPLWCGLPATPPAWLEARTTTRVTIVRATRRRSARRWARRRRRRRRCIACP